MGLNPNPKVRNLPEMTDSADAPEEYLPPAPAPDELIIDQDIAIGEHAGHVYMQYLESTLVVDFSFSLLHPKSERPDRNIIRSDCKHSCVHRHQYRPNGTDALNGHEGRGAIREIPPAPEGYKVVDSHYDEEYSWVFHNAEDHIRRWKGAR